MKRNKLGIVLTAAGLLFISAALLLAVYNIRADMTAAQLSDSAVGVLLPPGKKTSSPPTKREPLVVMPDYVKNPDMEMPVMTVNGVDYIGVLELPALGLKLPVAQNWSYPLLRVAPCRYYGSVYKNNMVIAAHNYRCHFGRLRTLAAGDKVLFTDSAGNVFNYEVYDCIMLQPGDRDMLINGDSDLTLFTCTYGGRQRITVRCVLAGF